MKKFFLFLMVLLAVTAMVHSEGIDIGKFPLGKWLDSNWQAVWEFNSDNIRILNTDGDLIFDFGANTIKDWSVKPGTKGLVLSFYCPETGKKYQFIKPVTNMDLLMTIDKDSGAHYEVKLPYQK